MHTRDKIIFLLVLSIELFSCIHLSAQILTANRHKPVTTDSLLVYKLPYIHVNDTGRNCLWNFADISTDSAEYIDIFYYALMATDTAHFGLHRERVNYYYNFHTDTLWLTDFENSRAHVRFQTPIPWIRFPFHYGDSMCCDMSGFGQYCHFLPLTLQGNYMVSAEATGRLLLPNIVVDSALLVHSKIEYYETSQQKNHVQEDIYQWYSPFCRYPLIETRQVQTITVNDTLTFATSYYHPQEEQIIGFPEDTLPNSSTNMIDSLITDVAYSPNPVSTTLYVNYTLSRSAQVYISLHYNGGISTFQTPIHQEDEGVRTTSINMSGLPIGTYVVYIHADDTIVSGNIIKI